MSAKIQAPLTKGRGAAPRTRGPARLRTTFAKSTVFKQGQVDPDTVGRGKTRKDIGGKEDIDAFFMLADAMCSDRKVDCIEKFDVGVFKNRRIASPEIPDGLIDTIEVMLDPDMMSQIRAGKSEKNPEKMVPWKKVKANP